MAQALRVRGLTSRGGQGGQREGGRLSLEHPCPGEASWVTRSLCGQTTERGHCLFLLSPYFHRECHVDRRARPGAASAPSLAGPRSEESSCSLYSCTCYPLGPTTAKALIAPLNLPLSFLGKTCR